MDKRELFNKLESILGLDISNNLKIKLIMSSNLVLPLPSNKFSRHNKLLTINKEATDAIFSF